MRAFELLYEEDSNFITVYHGDDYDTSSLNPALMNNGNNQEGIGIYFSNNISTARRHGKHVVKAYINPRKFINSRAYVKNLKMYNVVKLLTSLWKYNNKEMFYWISDWSPITKPEEINQYYIMQLANNISSEQVRNFQITLANVFGVDAIVDAWNKFIKIDGTFNKNSENETWYAIINSNITLKHII